MSNVSTHLHGDHSANKIMRNVIIALLPLMFVSFYFFGIGAIIVTVTSVASCILIEYLIQRFFFDKNENTINDGSAIITGILLAFNLPSSLPIWMVIIGSLVAIGIAKMSYGGIGKNIFNPALVGRVFLLISFPVEMTKWPLPLKNTTALTDAITGPTMLSSARNGMFNGHALSKVIENTPSYIDMFFGNKGGSLGEVSVLVIIIGGLFLLFKKIISWHTPVSFILTVFIFTGILWEKNPNIYMNPVFHILAGGLMLGAIFMATDPVTSPMTKNGKIIFGLGCGIITVIIRTWGSYPEGVSFAILIMNAFVPLINNGFRPKRFGRKRI